MTMENAAEYNFWWNINLETEVAGDSPSAEEALLTVADLSGSIGSELVEEGDKLILKAAYRASHGVDYWLEAIRTFLPSYERVRILDYNKVENRSWHEDHLEAFPPLPVGEHLVVMAPWHKGKEPEDRIPLYIYPSSAFGTGYHESTQIALGLLEKYIQPGDTVIDIGTGTGVLFIAALKLGAQKAIARDLDPTTISEVLRNMELNALSEGLCDLKVGDLLKGVEAQADILTANILLEPNIELLPEVKRVLRPGGVAIFAGMTVLERQRFLTVLTASGLELMFEATRNEWWGCVAKG